MSNNFLCGVIGFRLGGITGGIIAGLWIGKECKKTVDKLQYENSKLKERKHDEFEKELERRDTEVQKKAEKLIQYSGYVRVDGDLDADSDEDFDSEDDISFEDPFEKGDDEDEDSDDDSEDGKRIRLISREEYDQDVVTRDSETLTYYHQDGVLADELDDPVLNQTDVIGIDGVEKAEQSEDDIIYISNDIEDKVYEVVIERNESFYRDIER